MKLYKRATIYFNNQEEDLLAAFANDKLSSEKEVEELREICCNLLYAIQNDSKTVITDIRPTVLKKGESNG